jgi:CheY-like chemotaxis protein
VLVDLLTPGLDGFRLLEQLGSDAATEDIPIVVVTAEEMTLADSERLAGQISYLARRSAFGGSELVELVDRLAAAGPDREEVP